VLYKQEKNTIFKIGDLGCSRPLSILQGTPVGTLSYLAPEISNNSYYGTEVDLYSFGVIMKEMDGHTALNYPPEWHSLRDNLMNHSPSKRPKATNIISILMEHVNK